MQQIYDERIRIIFDVRLEYIIGSGHRPSLNKPTSVFRWLDGVRPLTHRLWLEVDTTRDRIKYLSLTISQSNNHYNIIKILNMYSGPRTKYYTPVQYSKSYDKENLL